MSIHPINTRLFLTATLGFTIGFGLPACRSIVSNPYHCQLNKGDSYCRELYGDEKSFCSAAACLTTSPDGCTAAMPSETECYYPCGGGLSVVDDDSCLEGGEETETETETSDTETDTETETGPEDCVDNGDCDNPDAPFCDDASGECIACDGVMDPDAACAEVDASVPLCIEGACVQCAEEDDAACGDLTPICDIDTNTCIGCSEHEQCPDSACNLAEGNCFDPASTLHVDGDNGDCGAADGSESSPYCTIGAALIALSEGALVIVHERNLETPYTEFSNISIDVAMFAADGENPVLQGNGGQPALIVTGSGSLSARRLVLANGPAEGLQVAGGQAWIEQSRIVNNSGGGIVVDGGGSLVLENSFVGGNVDDVDAVLVIDGGVQVNYSTLAGGGDFGETASALSCNAGMEVIIRNSILVAASAGPGLVCADATVTNSALEESVGDNVVLGELVPGWFSDYLVGDFSLSGAHPEAIDMAATWLDGDPATDINGDARPTTNGMSDFAGADRIP